MSQTGMRLGRREREELRAKRLNANGKRKVAAMRVAGTEVAGDPRLSCEKVMPSSGSVKRAGTVAVPWGFTRARASKVRKIDWPEPANHDESDSWH